MALFLNVETGSPLSACPPDLVGPISRAEASLRVFIEVNDWSLRTDPAGLLRTIDHARFVGWGVSVDDVGESTGWLSLLPMLAPDVVKIDVRRLRARSDVPVTAGAVVAATRHVEATGASLVVKGIESVADERLARALGAVYGQGRAIGTEAALPAAQRPPREVIPLIGAREPIGEMPESPWDALTALPPRHVDETTFHDACAVYVERAMTARSRPVVLVGLGHPFPEETQQEEASSVHGIPGLSELAAGAGLAASFAVGEAPEPREGMRGVALHTADPLAGRRFLVLMTESLAVAALAVPDRSSGLLDVHMSQDPWIVDRIAQYLICRVPPVGSSHRALAPPQAPVAPPAVDDDVEEAETSDRRPGPLDGFAARLRKRRSHTAE